MTVGDIMLAKKTLLTLMTILIISTIGCSTKTVTNDFAATVDRLNIKVRELERENEQLKKQLGTQNTPAPAITPTSTAASIPKPATASFTNKFGTPTTKCAHSGCNNYIATSGDTNCCTTHSKRCAECRAYIDEDAMWCMSCLTKALQ